MLNYKCNNKCSFLLRACNLGVSPAALRGLPRGRAVAGFASLRCFAPALPMAIGRAAFHIPHALTPAGNITFLTIQAFIQFLYLNFIYLLYATGLTV